MLHLLDNYIFVDGDAAGLAGRGSFGRLDSVCGSIVQASQRTTHSGKIPVYDINDAGRSGGVVIRLSAVKVRCMYGADVGSWNIPGGCNTGLGWCDEYANEPLDRPCQGARNTYDCRCCTRTECNGQQVKPWRAKHMRSFLEFYSRFGGHASCCGSGYNEIIMAGNEEWNTALPDAIEAFFYDVERRSEASWGGAPKKVADTREGFIHHWGLDPHDVPLLEFDRNNWMRPFTDVLARQPSRGWYQ